ncbi:MAG: hypothetical protein R3D55_22165 [Chloroflexota bacterium]
MGKVKQLGWLLVLAGLLGCGGESEGVATAVSAQPTPSATATTPPPTATLTATAVPSATPTATPEATVTPALLILPEAYAARVQNAPAGIWPNNVWWLPEVSGERPFLIQTGNQLAWQQLPIEPQKVFAYDGERGLLYFGEQVGEPEGGYATTDLRVYDFRDGTTMTLLKGNVAAMVWCSLRPVLAVMGDGRLNLMMPVANAELDVVARDVSPTFSCIPGYLPPPADGGPGKLIAYQRGADLLLVNWFDGPTDLLAEGALSPEITVPPVWDLTNEVLLVANETVLLVPLHRSRYFAEERPFGSEPFNLSYASGTPFVREGIRQLFWSPQHRILLLQTERPYREVTAYALSEQLRYVLDEPSLPRWRNAQIVGWLVDGEQIILLDAEGEPLVWNLATGEEERP